MKIVAVAVAVVLALQVLVLPAVISRVVGASLAGLGLSEVTFEVRAASFFHTDLANVEVGKQGLVRVGRIGVDYSPGLLLRGRVGTISLTGAEVQVAYRDGRLDLGPLSLSGSGASGGELPLDRVEFRACVLAVVWEGRGLWVPLEGSLLNQGRGRSQLDAVLRVQGRPVRLAGAYDAGADRMDLIASAEELDAAALGAAVPQRYAGKTPWISSGTVGVRAEYVRTPEQTRLVLSSRSQGVRLGASMGEHRMWVQDLQWTATAALDGNFRLIDVSGAAKAKRMSFGGESATNVEMELAKEKEQLLIRLSARGEDWLLRSLKASLGGFFAAEPGGAYTGRVSVDLDAKVPRQVAGLLLMRRIDVGDLGSISASGQIDATAERGADGNWLWKASTDQMLVQLSPGDLSFNKGVLALRGLSGVMRVSGKADNTLAEISIVPGSSVWVGSMEQSLCPIEVRKARIAPLAAVSIDAEPARFSMRFDGPGESWAFRVPCASMSVPELTASTGSVRMEGLEAVVRVRGEAAPSRLEVVAEEGSAVSFKSLEMALGEDQIRAGPWKLGLVGDGGEPLIRILEVERGGKRELSFQVRSERSLNVKTSVVDAAIESVGMRGTLVMPGEGGLALRGTVSMAGGSANSEAALLRIGGVSAEIPVSWNAASQEPGQMVISSIQVRDVAYPPAKGAIRVAGTRAEAQLDWPFLKDVARLAAQGWVELGGEQVRGRISGSIPAFALKDEKALSGLIKELAEFEISGTFGSEAAVLIEGGSIKPLVSLAMKDVRIASKEYDRSVEGVNGTVTIDSFSPLTTPGGQRLTVGKANAGQVRFTDGDLRFRVENTSLFHVEGTDWGWAGGRVYVNSFRLDLAKPAVDLTVFGDNLSLAQLLGMFGEEQYSGEGSLYGRLPVHLTWPQKKKGVRTVTEWSEPQLEFGAGFVYAKPGGGVLSVVSPERTLGALLEKQNPDFASGGKMEAVKSSLMGALKSLRYSVLMVDLVKEEGGLMARLLMSGVGANGQEIGGLTVNIRGFDAILRNIISIRREMTFGE